MKKNASYSLINKYNNQGFLLVAGIDEVGRGSLAGPLVSAVVVLPPRTRFKYYDSKVINKTMRLRLYNEIIKRAIGYGTGWVSNTEIDTKGLAWALKESYLRALVDMGGDFSRVIIDGSHNYLSEFDFSENIEKADSTVACVAAASIIAKHKRDEYMTSISNKFVGYNFENNMGYGTASHIKSIKEKGLSDIHRKTFCKKLV